MYFNITVISCILLLHGTCSFGSSIVNLQCTLTQYGFGSRKATTQSYQQSLQWYYVWFLLSQIIG